MHSLGVLLKDEDPAETARRVREALRMVGMPQDAVERYPSEFSGGQRQRIAIARALVLSPRLIICDEPVSALDLSIQAQILNLLADLKADLGLSMLFISHDLAVVRHIADTIVVLRDGRIVEQGPAAQLYDGPQTDYTRRLFAAQLRPGRKEDPAPESQQAPTTPIRRPLDAPEPTARSLTMPAGPGTRAGSAWTEC